jgi:PTS system mannose-specific IIC component
MIPDAGVYVLLCVFGAWVALDGTSVGQLMVSRPLVAATVGGWIAGAPGHGAALGLILEALHLTVLPVGAARYPEGGPAAVVASGVYATSGLGASALLTSVVFALAWERVGGDSVRRLRQFNVKLVPQADEQDLSPSRLERRHFTAIGVDCIRGLVLVAAGIPLLTAVMGFAQSAWGLGERIPAIILATATAGALAGALQLFRGAGRVWLFVIGALAGVLAVLLS